MDRNYFLDMYGLDAQDLIDLNINWVDLYNILQDYKKSIDICDARLTYVANVLRQHPKVHSVKTRVKDPKRLLQKLVRKTPDRREKYGDNFNFSIQNYKDEITDLMGIRVIHLFKEDWEEIHKFITERWEVIEIVANIREGDNVAPFEEKSIPVRSRISGYRSVHYLIKYGTKYDSSIIEIQVRTIFEEGYGEIDHQLRYSHENIPELLGQNLMLLNRIAGSSDEMASLINMLSQSIQEVENNCKEKIKEKDMKIQNIKEKISSKDYIDDEDKKSLIAEIDNILKI